MAQGIRLSDQDRLDWLRLIRSENIGPRTFRTLLEHFGSAAAALDALPDLARRGGAPRAARICSPAEAERELAAAHAHGVEFVALGEPDYPYALAAIPDPPPLLGVRGNIAALSLPQVAMVGSRNASAAALKITDMLAREIGAAGFAIVSGLARGIDAAAHRGSLSTGTIAVLAGGPESVYPPEHDGLLRAVLETGAAVSEMPIGWELRASDFPRRNRIISGLSLGVVVVEAAKRSGSLITARLALEQGREVFAVPGSPLDPRAEGTNHLLKQGATLVTEAADVLEGLRPLTQQPRELEEPDRLEPKPGMSKGAADDRKPPAGNGKPRADEGKAFAGEASADQRARIVTLLGPTPVSVDDLVRLSGASPAHVRVVLLELDLAGRLRRHGSGLVSL